MGRRKERSGEKEQGAKTSWEKEKEVKKRGGREEEEWGERGTWGD